MAPSKLMTSGRRRLVEQPRLLSTDLDNDRFKPVREVLLAAAGIRPKPAFRTGASTLTGNANAAFGSIATVHVNSVSLPAGSTR